VKAPRLNPRDRRAVLVGGALLVPALFFTLVGSPYLDALTERRARLFADRELLARELALVADARHYLRALSTVEDSLRSGAPRLFPGPDEISAAAALEAYVGEAAGRSRVLLRQSQSRSAGPGADGLLTLEADIRGTGDLRGVLAFLHALETGAKLVHVDQLSIDMGQGARPEHALSFGATVRGYALEAPAAAPGSAP
jgi:hypothetical protein